jgi:hypothetical protein
MSNLKTDLERVKSRALALLSGEHDYFDFTKAAWNIVINLVVHDGRSISIRNLTTGTVTENADLVANARDYIGVHLTESTFQQFVSIFESFFWDVTRLWLTAYPASLGAKTVSFKHVLGSRDKDALIAYVIERHVTDLVYDRPDEWFSFLDKTANLGCPSDAEIKQFVEAKASRDVLVHNEGIANARYVEKSGDAKRFKEGERIEISEPYHRATWQLIRKLVTDISDAAIAKVT